MSEPTTGTGPSAGAGDVSGIGNGWTRASAPSGGADPRHVEVEVINADAVPVVETADQVAALVLAVPGVTRLHAGRFGEVATYLPGRRVTGIKLTDDRVEVHVVLAADTPLRSVAQQLHAVVAAVVTVPVQVFIEDLDTSHAA